MAEEKSKSVSVLNCLWHEAHQSPQKNLDVASLALVGAAVLRILTEQC